MENYYLSVETQLSTVESALLWMSLNAKIIQNLAEVGQNKIKIHRLRRLTIALYHCPVANLKTIYDRNLRL